MEAPMSGFDPSFLGDSFAVPFPELTQTIQPEGTQELREAAKHYFQCAILYPHPIRSIPGKAY